MRQTALMFGGTGDTGIDLPECDLGHLDPQAMMTMASALSALYRDCETGKRCGIEGSRAIVSAVRLENTSFARQQESMT